MRVCFDQYQNCDEAAEEYGAPPIYEGETGFHPGFDRDGDGVGREP
ncbi:excalibur calcium-binding domain-containing protein [Cytobacillus praedii]